MNKKISQVQINKNSNVAIYKRLLVILVILTGIVINVSLIGQVVRTNSYGQITSVNLFLTPESTTIPPDTTLKLMIDPQQQLISFIRVQIAFNPNVINLQNEVNVNTSMGNIFKLTSMSEANSTGTIEIVLTQNPSSTPVTQVFEVASFSFTGVSEDAGKNILLTIVDEEVQIVDRSSNELSFTTNYAIINPSSSFPRMAKSLLSSGNCPSEGYVNTAIGCIPTDDPQALAAFFLSWAIGIGGGIAFILMIYSGFLITTSQANPQRLNAGRELLNAAALGLLFLLFGVYILKLIGVDILGINF